MNKVDERLTKTAKQTLEELKKQGVAEAEWQFDLVSYSTMVVEENDPGTQWDCTIRFKKEADGELLTVRFELRPGSDFEATVNQVITNKFQEYKRSHR